MSVKLYPGDNRQWLAALKAHDVQFHSVVTDPPYGIKFMGRKWDGGGIENDPTFWRAVLDVMLPGAYCFAFSSTRTVHRQMVAMEDAGFLLHPLHIWMFGCLDEKTMVATPDGEKAHTDLSEGDLVLCYDAENSEYSYQPIQEIVEYEYDDTAYRLIGDFGEQVVSRNHRCIVERDGREVFEYAETLASEACVPVLESLPDLQSALYNAEYKGRAPQDGSSYKSQCNGQSTRKPDAVRDERRAQGVRAWSGHKTAMVRVVPFHKTGRVWCLRVPTGAFVAVRDGVAFPTGNSGFPKAHAADKAIDKRGGAPHLAEQIGAALKEAREKRGVTKSQADKMFCGGSTNYSWFEGRPSGICPPTSETFDKIVETWPELAEWRDKVREATREVTGQKKSGISNPNEKDRHTIGASRAVNVDITAPATPEAQRWAGWAYGTQAQKPALEPIVLAQKPFSEKTGAANILKHGVGAVNIDGTRVGTEERTNAAVGNKPGGNSYNMSVAGMPENAEPRIVTGRHPANLIHDGSDEVRALFPNDSSRFFHEFPADEQGAYYYPKASKADRAGSKHPTVKPVALMQHLIRHITPPGGTVLDPFAGSGTTGEAAKREGFDCVLMEQEPEYIAFLADRFSDDA